MRFSDIVKDSDRAVYRHIKFSHKSTGNVNMVAWKPEVHFMKSISRLKATNIFNDYFHIFMDN